MAVTLPVSAPAASPIALPPAPRTAEETGLPFSFVCDLVLKVLYFNGSMLGRDIANHLCLPFSFIETTTRFLADEGYCSSTGMHTAALDPGEPINAGMQHMISTTGRQRARGAPRNQPVRRPGTGADRRLHGHGRAPVPRRRRRSTAPACMTRSATSCSRKSCSTTSGPALSAREAVFLYGPPGNGKTTIAEAAASLLGRADVHPPGALRARRGDPVLRPDPPRARSTATCRPMTVAGSSPSARRSRWAVS